MHRKCLDAATCGFGYTPVVRAIVCANRARRGYAELVLQMPESGPGGYVRGYLRNSLSAPRHSVSAYCLAYQSRYSPVTIARHQISFSTYQRTVAASPSGSVVCSVKPRREILLPSTA
jgi:hypothetical protein